MYGDRVCAKWVQKSEKIRFRIYLSHEELRSLSPNGNLKIPVNLIFLYSLALKMHRYELEKEMI